MAVESTVVPAQLYDPTNGRFNSTPIRQGWTGADPSTFYPEEGQTYVKRVVYGTQGVYELCFMDSQGRVIQITKNGFLDTGEIAPPLVFTLPAASNPIIQSQVTGDTAFRYQVNADGTTSWGPGNAASDVSLSRQWTHGLQMAQGSGVFNFAYRYSGDNFGVDNTDSTIFGSPALQLVGVRSSEYLSISSYSFGHSIDFQNFNNAIEFHGYDTLGSTGWHSLFTISCLPSGGCNIQVRNPNDTDGWYVSFATTPTINTITNTTMVIGVGGTNYLELNAAGTPFFGGLVSNATDLGGASNTWKNIRYGSQIICPAGSASTPSIMICSGLGLLQASTTVMGISNLTTTGQAIDGSAGGATRGFRMSSDSFLSWWNTTDIGTASANDLFLLRDATGIAAFRNGTNAQDLRVYNTYSSSTSGEYLELTWQAFANQCVLWTQKGSGGGSARALNFGTGGSTYWQVSTAGMFLALTDNSNDIGASGASRPRSIYWGTQALAPQNASATAPDYAWSGNTNYGIYLRSNAIIALTFNGTEKIAFAGGNAQVLSSDTALNWSTTTSSTGSQDTGLVRDAASVLALKSGTNAMTFRVYGTTTGSVYSYLNNDGTNTHLNNSAGTLNLGRGGTDYWQVNTSGMFLANTDNANDIGASGATRPRNLFLGGTLTTGGAFTSGGQITWPTGLGVIVHVLGPTDQVLKIQGGSGQNLQLGSSAGVSGSLVINGLTVSTTANTSLTFNGLQNGITIAKQASPANGNSGTLTLTNAADTGLTASVEAFNVNFNMSASRQWATGNFATQRECIIQAPTYTAVGASTITTAATLAITGAPIQGTNVTLTNTYALWVQAGLTAHGGGIIFTTDNSFNIGASGATRPANLFYGTQIVCPAGSTATPAILIGANAGLTSDGGNLIKVSNLSTGGMAFDTNAGGATRGLRLSSDGMVSWFNTTDIDSASANDLFLLRDAAGTLAHRNGTNAQQVNVYNTFTSSTSFERLEINWITSANVCNIWTNKGSGGGSVRVLQLGVGGTGYWQVNTSGNLQPVTDNANNLGVTGTNRVLNFYQTGIWQQEGANGQLFTEQQVTELTTIAAAATTDTALTVPANAVILAVSVRVVTVIPTATTFTVTATTGGTQFNTAAVSVAAGSTDPGTKAGAFYQSAATHIRFTPSATPATGTGQVRVTVYYYTVTPPTS